MLASTLASLPWSDEDDVVSGLSVEQQVAWQRLLRACQRSDGAGMEQLAHRSKLAYIDRQAGQYDLSTLIQHYNIALDSTAARLHHVSLPSPDLYPSLRCVYYHAP